MADEADTNDGSLETAVASLKEARQAAAQDNGAGSDGNEQQDGSDGAHIAATEERSQKSPPVEQEADEAAEVEADPIDAEHASNIDAPAWFNAEEKEAFLSLPPEAQASLARLAKSAQAHISQRQNEHQAAMRAAQEAEAVAAQERQYLQSAIQQYRHPIVAAYNQEFPDVVQGRTDLFRLAQDPERWNRFQAFQSQFAELGRAEQHLAQRAELEERNFVTEHVETRNAQLIEAKPELRDPAKFEQYDTEVTTYLRGLGIPDERIARASYADLKVVEKAMLWDKAQKAKAQAPKQPQAQSGQAQSHVRSVPKLMKPGTTRDAGTADDRIAAAKQQLRKTGSVDDAAASIRLLLNRSRVRA